MEYVPCVYKDDTHHNHGPLHLAHGAYESMISTNLPFSFLSYSRHIVILELLVRYMLYSILTPSSSRHRLSFNLDVFRIRDPKAIHQMFFCRSARAYLSKPDTMSPRPSFNCSILSFLFIKSFHLSIFFFFLRMKGGLVNIKFVVKMLRKVLSRSILHDSSEPAIKDHHRDHENVDLLPEDVKEGHFAVYAVGDDDDDDDGELRRFIIEISYLSHPGFLKLLKQAEEEFGFEQSGVLAIPCTYRDLQTVVASKEKS
ncbi:hypothetical protein OROMI_012158 [Orobanche minor]